MKKYIFITAALLASVACAKVETVETAAEKAITFDVVNYSLQTRVSAYDKANSFGTYAYATPTDWDTDGDANVFFNNEKVSYGPTYAPNEWGTASQNYWPKVAKLTFASYSPYVSAAGQGFSAVPAFSKAKGFEFPDYQIVETTDVDLMVADLVTDQTANQTQYVVSGNTQGVPTLFHHVLTQVAFQFKTVANPNPNVAGFEVVVKDVTIQNINNKGSYTQIPADANAKVWAGQTGTETYVFNEATSPITMDDPSKTYPELNEGEKLFSRILMPQTLVASTPESTPAVNGQQVVVTYTIRTNYGTASEPKWTEENVTSTVDLLPPTETGSTTTAITEWEPNMSIVYTLTISPFSDVPILFDPAVADWSKVDAGITIDKAD